MTEICIVTGSQNVGKTTTLLEVVGLIRQINLSVCGLISPGLYQDDHRIAIQVENLESGETTRLADYQPGWDPQFPQKKWKMHPAAIAWGNAQLRSCDPVGKIFILDEIGIFELLDQQGWQAGLDIVRAKKYLKALVSVRKELVGEMQTICGDAHIGYKLIDLDETLKEKKEISGDILRYLLH